MTPRRIGWNLVASHMMDDDLGNVFDLRVLCPADLKVFLIRGIQRWRGERLLQHSYAADTADQVWHRGLRNSSAGIKCVRRLGALQAHRPGGPLIPQLQDALQKTPARPC
eukprot:2845144-Pyramimonas_sp.AAC.1